MLESHETTHESADMDGLHQLKTFQHVLNLPLQIADTVTVKRVQATPYLIRFKGVMMIACDDFVGNWAITDCSVLKSRCIRDYIGDYIAWIARTCNPPPSSIGLTTGPG